MGARPATARRGVAERIDPLELGPLPGAPEARADVAEQRRELRKQWRARQPRAAAKELPWGSPELPARLLVRRPAKVTWPQMTPRSQWVRKQEQANAVTPLTATPTAEVQLGASQCLYRSATARLVPRRREQLAEQLAGRGALAAQGQLLRVRWTLEKRALAEPGRSERWPVSVMRRRAWRALRQRRLLVFCELFPRRRRGWSWSASFSP